MIEIKNKYDMKITELKVIQPTSNLKSGLRGNQNRFCFIFFLILKAALAFKSLNENSLYIN